MMQRMLHVRSGRARAALCAALCTTASPLSSMTTTTTSAAASAAAVGSPLRRWHSTGSADTNGFVCDGNSHHDQPEMPPNVLLESIAKDTAALQNLHDFLASDANALAAIEACAQHIAECHARDRLVYVTGVGKSGIVAQRLASTLASISVRSQWIHGSEWVHGELGNLRHEDVVIILSHSGKTPELLELPHLFQASECPVIAITSDAHSPLALKCDVAIVAPADDHELCPVPSRSIVVQESICNAMVEHLVHRMGDCAINFRGNHPGGSIGDQFSNGDGSE